MRNISANAKQYFIESLSHRTTIGEQLWFVHLSRTGSLSSDDYDTPPQISPPSHVKQGRIRTAKEELYLIHVVRNGNCYSAREQESNVNDVKVDFKKEEEIENEDEDEDDEVVIEEDCKRKTNKIKHTHQLKSIKPKNPLHIKTPLTTKNKNKFTSVITPDNKRRGLFKKENETVKVKRVKKTASADGNGVGKLEKKVRKVSITSVVE